MYVSKVSAESLYLTEHLALCTDIPLISPFPFLLFPSLLHYLSCFCCLFTALRIFRKDQPLEAWSIFLKMKNLI